MANSKKIKVIVLNYNLGEYADELNEKLVSDGFKKDEIILVDNGSDKAPAAKYTNFQLPYNVRVSEQINIVLRYLIYYFPHDYYFIISTSARLIKKVNYFEAAQKAVSDLANNRVGFITCSFIGDNLENNPQLDNQNLSRDYTLVTDFQPIATIYSSEIIETCLKRGAGPFNLDLKRGWGMDLELKFIAETLKMENYVSKELVVEWRQNYLHNIGLADESVESYRRLASEEMFVSFNKRYGKKWQVLFGIKEKATLVQKLQFLRDRIKEMLGKF